VVGLPHPCLATATIAGEGGGARRQPAEGVPRVRPWVPPPASAPPPAHSVGAGRDGGREMRVGGVGVGREGIKKLCVGDEGEIRRNMDA
jgi:hypothetical protein